MILWLKVCVNDNAKSWENENASFSKSPLFHKFYSKNLWNTSEICLIRITFVLASHLIFKIEAFKKHVLVHRIITPSLGLSFQYILSLEG